MSAANLDTLPDELLDKIAEDCYGITTWLDIWAVNRNTRAAFVRLGKARPITRFLARFPPGRSKTPYDMIYNISTDWGQSLSSSDIDTILQTVFYHKDFVKSINTNDIFIHSKNNIGGAIYIAIHRIVDSIKHGNNSQRYTPLLCRFRSYICLLYNCRWYMNKYVPDYISQYLTLIGDDYQSYGVSRSIEDIRIVYRPAFPYAEIITEVFQQTAMYSRVNDPQRCTFHKIIKVALTKKEWECSREDPLAAFIKIVNKATESGNLADKLIIY